MRFIYIRIRQLYYRPYLCIDLPGCKHVNIQHFVPSSYKRSSILFFAFIFVICKRMFHVYCDREVWTNDGQFKIFSSIKIFSAIPLMNIILYYSYVFFFRNVYTTQVNCNRNLHVMISKICSTIPLDILTIFSPSITLNYRNIFLIYIQLNFSWIKQILQTKKLLFGFKYNSYW